VNLLETVAGVVLIVCGVGTGALTTMMIHGSRSRMQAIADTETTPIGEITTGRVELKGTARVADDHGTVATPDKDTLAVRFTAHERNAGEGANWPRIFAYQNAAPFLLTDDTGEVLIDPPTDGRTYNFAGSGTVQRPKAGEEASDAVREFVERIDTSDSDKPILAPEERRRYVWKTLDPESEVYVLGEAEQADGWEREYVVTSGDEDFIFSDKSEEQLRRGGTVAQVLILAIGGLVTLVLFAVGGGLFFL